MTAPRPEAVDDIVAAAQATLIVLAVPERMIREFCANLRSRLDAALVAARADEREKLTRPADAVRDGVVIPNAVVQFLLGAAPIDGKWFGDLHPKHPGRLWWRRLLRAALAQDGRG